MSSHTVDVFSFVPPLLKAVMKNEVSETHLSVLRHRKIMLRRRLHSKNRFLKKTYPKLWWCFKLECDENQVKCDDEWKRFYKDNVMCDCSENVIEWKLRPYVDALDNATRKWKAYKNAMRFSNFVRVHPIDHKYHIPPNVQEYLSMMCHRESPNLVDDTNILLPCGVSLYIHSHLEGVFEVWFQNAMHRFHAPKRFAWFHLPSGTWACLPHGISHPSADPLTIYKQWLDWLASVHTSHTQI